MALAEDRALAHRVAKLLAEKGRGEEAVAVLAAWAASGPNDTLGQELLAEALRLDPGSPIAKMAFQRMEGLAGESEALEQAIARFDTKALVELERQNKRPVFNRAQLGFNNNVQYGGATYHVQTEDSGVDRPHIITWRCASHCAKGSTTRSSPAVPWAGCPSWSTCRRCG
jgi:hypothetical protein